MSDGTGKYVDVHVHSIHSMDAHQTVDDICRRAIELGLKGICITDHVENDPVDIGYGKYFYEKYFEDVDRAREKYGSSLEILTGCEFSEPHRYPESFEKYAQLPYDSVIGSVHYWIGSEMVEDMVLHRTLEESFDAYWEAVRQLVHFGGFTILGHIDFPKRFFMDSTYETEVIREIFETVIQKEIVPEINTSTLQKGLKESMPDKDLLDIYKSCGGKRICLGSDAHYSENIARYFSYAEQLAGKEKLEIGYFKNRTFVSV